MKNNRRDFLKIGSLAGLGLAGAGVMKGFASETEQSNPMNSMYGHSTVQTFNMSGYAAPKIPMCKHK